jgi:hypothetical protein
VTDDLDKDLNVVSVVPSQGSCDAVGPSNEIRCELGDLAAKASATVTITVQTDKCEIVKNTSHVNAANEEEDSRSNEVLVEIVCPTPTPTPAEETATPTPTPAEETATPTPTPTTEGSVSPGTGTPAPTPSTEQSVEAGTGTPAASVPNTAIGSGSGSMQLPTLLFGLLLVASLGGLLVLNVKSAIERR